MELTKVDFDTAKFLKELGFNWDCDSYYDQALFEGTNPQWEGIFTKFTFFERKGFHNNLIPNVNELWYGCSRPTQALVVRWFREIHDISIECGYAGHRLNDPPWVTILCICNKRTLEFVVDGQWTGDTFEESELKGIKAAINHLLKPKK